MDRSAKIIVTIVVIIASGFFIYSKFAGWHTNKLETAIAQEKKICRDKAAAMNTEIDSLKKELAAVKGQNVSNDKLAKIFGEKTAG